MKINTNELFHSVNITGFEKEYRSDIETRLQTLGTTNYRRFKSFQDLSPRESSSLGKGIFTVGNLIWKISLLGGFTVLLMVAASYSVQIPVV